MELTVQNVYGLLLRSKLLSLDEAKTMYRALAGGGQGRGRQPGPLRLLDGGQQVPHRVPGHACWPAATPTASSSTSTRSSTGSARAAWPASTRRQHRLGQIVAIKVLPPSKAKDADAARPLPARGPAGHAAEAPQHRPHLPGRRRRRAALPRHGVPGRRDARGRAGAARQAAAAARRCGWSTRRCRACSTSTTRGWSTATSSRPT